MPGPFGAPRDPFGQAEGRFGEADGAFGDRASGAEMGESAMPDPFGHPSSPGAPGDGALPDPFDHPSPTGGPGDSALPDPFDHPSPPGTAGGTALPDPFDDPSPPGNPGESALPGLFGTQPPPGEDTIPPGMAAEGPVSADPYGHLWRPDDDDDAAGTQQAHPGAPGLPPGDRGDRGEGPAALLPGYGQDYGHPDYGHPEYGPPEYGTMPGGDYLGTTGPFRSAGSSTAATAGPDSADRTSAFESPPLPPEGPPHGSLYPPPPDGGNPAASQMGPGASQMGPYGQYRDEFPMGDYLRPPLPQPGMEPPDRRRKSRKALMIGGSAAAAVIVVAGAAYALTRHAPAAPRPTSSPTATQQLTNINNVQTDPTPITGKEIFPHARVTEHGQRFSRAAQVVNRNCELTARGKFSRALKADGCERVVRATYVDTHKHYAVTAGVAALPSNTAAQSADHKEDFKTGAWFTGLNGRHGSGAQNLQSAAGYAYDLVEGRYIIYAFATNANGAPLKRSAKTGRLLNSLSRSFAMMVRQPINARAQQPLNSPAKQG